jgi:hypothetical protein
LQKLKYAKPCKNRRFNAMQEVPFSKPKALQQSKKPSTASFVCPLLRHTLPVAAWI